MIGIKGARASVLIDKIRDILAYLPQSLREEIERIGCQRADYPEGLNEIRIRLYGRSSILISSENIPLTSRITKDEIEKVLDRAMGGSEYMHRGEISDGYFSHRGGVRVGVYGRATEGGCVKSISGLVFRIPSGVCDMRDELIRAWENSDGRGMLIYSPPGGGKTSAVRALAGYFGCERRMRVAVIDERREFFAEDYLLGTVDILSGYEKSRGIEIAIRTLNPELIIVDEIGSEREARALLRVGRGGIPIIATAHAADIDELLSKEAVAPLVKDGYFSLFAGLVREGKRFGLRVSARDSVLVI